MKLCSSDARSRGQPWPLPKREWKELDALAREKARLGALRVGRVKYCAQLETNQATPEQGVVSATQIWGVQVLR